MPKPELTHESARSAATGSTKLSSYQLSDLRANICPTILAPVIGMPYRTGINLFWYGVVRKYDPWLPIALDAREHLLTQLGNGERIHATGSGDSLQIFDPVTLEYRLQSGGPFLEQLFRDLFFGGGS